LAPRCWAPVSVNITATENQLQSPDIISRSALWGYLYCGSAGMVGFFATEGGLFYGGGTALLAVQAIGFAAVGAWMLATSFTLFRVIKATVGLRVSAKEEEEGLDIGEHGMEAYADFAKSAMMPQVAQVR